jgi:alcohol dehydrogenase (cytochrome c)
MRKGDPGLMKFRLILPLALLSSSLAAQVTYDRILHADREPQNWLTYSGNYAGHRYSQLNQINRSNVKNLQLRWVYHPTYLANSQAKMENTPLVVDGVMYTGTVIEVVALDAVTGHQFWKYSRPINTNPTGHVITGYQINKGMAISGDKLFWGTIDCHLIVLDIKTGRLIQDITMVDWHKGYHFTGVPLVVKNMVILGVATSEDGANCWADAYDINTGKEVWRFNTAPMSADDPIAKTWAGDSWVHGGNPIWNDGSYDPETNLVYFGIGNPNPGWNGDIRGGDNLYSECVVALDADTGKLKWYYQFTPGDEYDWDAIQIPVLLDMEWKGKQRKVMLWANRNGFFYVLDRTTGEYLSGEPFVKQNWAVGIDEKGRPIKAPGIWPKPMGGGPVMPGSQGGTNFYPPSYSPRTGLLYLTVWDNYAAFSGKGDPGPWVEGVRRDGNGSYARAQAAAAAGRGGRGGGRGAVRGGGNGVEGDAPGGGRAGRGPGRANAAFKTEEEGYSAIRALDPKTGEKKWEFKMVDNSEAGVLSTSGDLVFGGGREGDFVALDANNGSMLWWTYLGGASASGPMTYAVNGKQYLVGTAAGTMYVFTLPN